MNRDTASADDVQGLQAALGAGVPLTYLDQQHIEAVQAAARRWPLLSAVRRVRATPARAAESRDRG